MGLTLKRKLNYDPKSEELARHFLGATVSDALVAELADYIQFQVETWIQYDDRISDLVKAGKA